MTRDMAYARTLYEIGCEGGLAVACLRLSELYLTDEAPFAVDPQRSRSYREQACAFGDPAACITD